MLSNTLSYILSYIKSLILTWVVLPTLLPLFFIWSAFSSTLEMKWIKYLSFLNPLYSTGTFHVEGGDIMKIFGFVSLLFFAITELLKFAGVEFKLPHKIVVLLLTGIFAFAEFLTFYPTDVLKNILPNETGVFSLLFILFWVITLVAYFIWFKLSSLKSN